MIAWVLKVTLAHLLGDFLFQPDKWIEDKTLKTYKSKYLYFHTGIHFLLLLVILQFDCKYWWAMLLLPISHYLVELIKLLVKNRLGLKKIFFIDQVLHFAVIFLTTKLYFSFQIDFSQIFNSKVVFILNTLLILTYVTSEFIEVLISKWKMEMESNLTSSKYIGMLERILVFVFIVMNQWEGVGFLIAIKSVFRFGDSLKNTDKKLSEFYFLGTLVSFGIAIGIALAYQKLLKFI
jgi:hypothetical protein